MGSQGRIHGFIISNKALNCLFNELNYAKIFMHSLLKKLNFKILMQPLNERIDANDQEKNLMEHSLEQKESAIKISSSAQ